MKAKSNEKNYLVTISCGGGIGGSKWDEKVFIEDADYESAIIKGVSKFLLVRNANDDDKRAINTNWIVEITKI